MRWPSGHHPFGNSEANPSGGPVNFVHSSCRGPMFPRLSARSPRPGAAKITAVRWSVQLRLAKFSSQSGSARMQRVALPQQQKKVDPSALKTVSGRVCRAIRVTAKN